MISSHKLRGNNTIGRYDSVGVGMASVEEVEVSYMLKP